jgi:DNA-binding PadR family transcriptional regulator
MPRSARLSPLAYNCLAVLKTEPQSVNAVTQAVRQRGWEVTPSAVGPALASLVRRKLACATTGPVERRAVYAVAVE